MTLVATNDITDGVGAVTEITSDDGDLSITAGGDVIALFVETFGLGDVEVEAGSLDALQCAIRRR